MHLFYGLHKRGKATQPILCIRIFDNDGNYCNGCQGLFTGKSRRGLQGVSWGPKEFSAGYQDISLGMSGVCGGGEEFRKHCRESQWTFDGFCKLYRYVFGDFRKSHVRSYGIQVVLKEVSEAFQEGSVFGVSQGRYAGVFGVSEGLRCVTCFREFQRHFGKFQSIFGGFRGTTEALRRSFLGLRSLSSALHVVRKGLRKIFQH